MDDCKRCVTKGLAFMRSMVARLRLRGNLRAQSGSSMWLSSCALAVQDCCEHALNCNYHRDTTPLGRQVSSWVT
eukprot:2425787-Amphidinium_carterae.1